MRDRRHLKGKEQDNSEVALNPIARIMRNRILSTLRTVIPVESVSFEELEDTADILASMIDRLELMVRLHYSTEVKHHLGKLFKEEKHLQLLLDGLESVVIFTEEDSNLETYLDENGVAEET